MCHIHIKPHSQEAGVQTEQSWPEEEQSEDEDEEDDEDFVDDPNDPDWEPGSEDCESDDETIPIRYEAFSLYFSLESVKAV